MQFWKIRTIRGKMLLFFLVPVGIILGLTSYVILSSARSIASDQAKMIMEARAKENAQLVETDLESALFTIQTLAQIMEGYNDIDPGLRRQVYTSMLRKVITANPQYLGLWTCWKPGALDQKDESFSGSEGTDQSGRFIPYLVWNNETVILKALVDYETPGAGDYYLVPRDTRRPAIIEPYEYEIAGKTHTLITLSAPIMNEDGEVVGVVGLDMDTNKLQDKFGKVKVYETGFGRMLSAGKIVITHPESDRLGEIGGEFVDGGGSQIDARLNAGEIFTSVEYSASLGMDAVKSFVPIFIGEIPEPWSFAIVVPSDEIYKDVDALSLKVAGMSIGGLLLLVVILFVVARGLASPLGNVTNLLKDISEGEGDLTLRLPVTTQDEVGQLSQYFNQFVEKLQELVRQVNNNAQSVASSSAEFSAIAMETTLDASKSAEKADAVAAAVQQVSASMQAAADKMKQADSNLQTVAAAVEEMTATIGEIAQNSELARSTTGQAARQAGEFASAMHELSESAEQIGKVTETIASISAQTNLLALNATIEAARAGAAGKGFAVVAGEIKELARQTAQATGEIKSRISGVQESVLGATTNIDRIVGVVESVQDIVVAIAASIQEQTAVTQDIAYSIAQGSTVVREASGDVSQTSSVTQSVAQDINLVSQSSNQINQANEAIQQSAIQLSELAENLRLLTSRFKV